MTAAASGSVVGNPSGPECKSVVDLATPEGCPVFYDGSGSPHIVWIRISSTSWAKYQKSSDTPDGYSTSIRFDPAFLKNKQETYDGRLALDLDPDLDGITTAAEDACGLNPNDNDTDHDAILNGVEFHACAAFGDDRIPDGWVDFGAACTAPCVNVALGGSWGEDPNLNGVRDKDVTTGDWSETDFLASDSDVDGLGAEEWGRWCYKTESSSACNGATNRSVRQLWTASPAKNGALVADFATGKRARSSRARGILLPGASPHPL